MGVIRRQSIKNSIINYVAVVIGMANVLIIYPAVLTPSEFGQIRFILGTALLIATITGLGSTALSIRFFPEFKDQKSGHHGFLGILAILPATGFIIYLVSTLLASSHLPSEFKANYGYISAVVFFALYVKLLSFYSHNFKRIAIPAIFNNLFTKIGVPILAILFAREFISFQSLLYLLVVIYIISFVGLLIYLGSLGQLHFRIDRKFIIPERRKRLLTYMSFSVLGNLGGILSLRLDSFMVTELLNFERNGVYNISISISDIMIIPVTAIASIAAPLIAEKLQNNSMGEVDEIYKKSALNLAILGLLFMLIINEVINPFFKIMPNGELYQDAKIVALVLCLGRLIDMVTSVNAQIISNSKYFRITLYIILFVAAGNIALNFLLIPRFNIMGAALATVFSLFILNLIRTLYVQYKFKIHPFSGKLFASILLAVIVYGILYFIPDTRNPYLTIIIKGGLAFGLYSAGILYFKISTDINDLLDQALIRTGLKKRD